LNADTVTHLRNNLARRRLTSSIEANASTVNTSLQPTPDHRPGKIQGKGRETAREKEVEKKKRTRKEGKGLGWERRDCAVKTLLKALHFTPPMLFDGLRFSVNPV